jgi:hypothetical protein
MCYLIQGIHSLLCQWNTNSNNKVRKYQPNQLSTSTLSCLNKHTVKDVDHKMTSFYTYRRASHNNVANFDINLNIRIFVNSQFFTYNVTHNISQDMNQMYCFRSGPSAIYTVFDSRNRNTSALLWATLS